MVICLNFQFLSWKQSRFATSSSPLRYNSQQRFISLLNFSPHDTDSPKKFQPILSKAMWNQMYDCLCWSFCSGNFPDQNKMCFVSNKKNIDFNWYLHSVNHLLTIPSDCGHHHHKHHQCHHQSAGIEVA